MTITTTNNKKDEKFFIYARKSTDREDNQVESLPDQLKVLNRLAKERELKIVHTYKEAISAKIPHKRPEFDDMVKKLKEGKASGVLVWKVDRLARNFEEGGLIIQMLQDKVISRIVASDKECLPSDNVLMIAVDMGVATQYSKDLSQNVSRSVLSKFERGEYPSRAPIGYANFRESKKRAYVINDPERFELVRKMWDLMLTGTYNPRQICEIANKEWGLKTRPRPKHASKYLSYSNIYKMFTNIFYAGYLEYNGTQYKAAHTSMITLEEFDRVQKLLGKKGKPRAQTREFPFTGIIRCKECGCSITAELKPKLIKSTGKVKEYTYYHCTHRKRDYHCNQRKNLTDKKLEEQIIEKLEETQIFPEFYKFAVNKLKRTNQEEFAEKEQITKSLQKVVLQCDEKLERLLETKIEGLIDSDKYVQKKEEINREKALALEKLDSAEVRITNWTEVLERAVDFVMYAKINFINGTDQERREILSTMGQNLTIKDGLLGVGSRFWREPFKEIADFYKQKTAALEPAVSSCQTVKIEPNVAEKSFWWTREESNLQPLPCKGIALPLSYEPPTIIINN